MSAKVNIPPKIIEWLSISDGNGPWGASNEGLMGWFIKLWAEKGGKIRSGGLMQLKLENIRKEFEDYNKLDLYQALNQYFNRWGQIINIKGDKYVSQESFLNLQDKFRAYISSSYQSGEDVDMEEEDACADMFANHNEKFSDFTDEIKKYLDGPYTKGTHDNLKSMLEEIQKALNVCRSNGINVDKKYLRFSTLNKQYKSWRGQSKAKAKSKEQPKSKTKSKTKSNTKYKPTEPRRSDPEWAPGSKYARPAAAGYGTGDCSDGEHGEPATGWVLTFWENLTNVQQLMAKKVWDPHRQERIEGILGNMRKNLNKCKDNMPVAHIKERIFSFNEAYNEFKIWLGDKTSRAHTLKPLTAPENYKCSADQAYCLPSPDRGGTSKGECTSHCKTRNKDQQREDLTPDIFYNIDYNGNKKLKTCDEFLRDIPNEAKYKNGRRLSMGQRAKYLKKWYPTLALAEAVSTLGGHLYMGCMEDTPEVGAIMKKRKSKSKSKSKNKKATQNKEGTKNKKVTRKKKKINVGDTKSVRRGGGRGRKTKRR